MSYIDTFKHEHIGSVASVPIYLPLEPINGNEFKADENSIILGGGSGELAGYVLTPGDVIFAAIDPYMTDRTSFQLSELAKAALDVEGFTEDDYDELLEELLPIDTKFKYPEWTGDEWYAIATAAIAEGYEVKPYPRPGDTIVKWIEAQVGEIMLNDYFDRLTASLSPNAVKIIEIGAVLNPNLHAGRDARLAAELGEDAIKLAPALSLFDN